MLRSPSYRRLTLMVPLALRLAAAACEAQANAPVFLQVGADFQAAVDAHPAGTHYVISAGVHRGVRMVPKSGDTISGQPGAVLNGCLQLADWRHEGEYWVHDVPVLVPESSATGVACADMICTQTQDLYVDDGRLYASRTLDGLWDDRGWFLDRDSGRIYMRRDPTGREVEFGGPSPSAIDCSPPGLPAREGVIIEDLVIEKYPSPPQSGAVRLGGGSTCRRCVISDSHAYGIKLTGAAMIQNCGLYENGMCGIGGAGSSIIIEGCEISHNVWSYYAGPAWDNGGVKLAASSDVIFRRCFVHHNHGPGLWTDIRSSNVTVEECIVESNDWEGILFEISDRQAARRNICRWNGVRHRGALWGGQICVQNSTNVDIESNYLETGADLPFQWEPTQARPSIPSPTGSGQAVMVINQPERAWDEGVFGGSFSVRNISVRGNTFITPVASHSGIDYGVLGWNSYEDFLNAGLEWSNNSYYSGSALHLTFSWRLSGNWDTSGATWLGWEDWKQYQDAGSSLTTFGPDAYPPTGERQQPLIHGVTGLDYPTLKAALTRRDPNGTADSDADGLPDRWGEHYFRTRTGAEPAADPDGDGWTNLRELGEGTDPLNADSDGDGLPDAWEGARGMRPAIYDSDLDADDDGRSAREEYEDGTDPVTPDPLRVRLPEDHLSAWLATTSGLEVEAGGRLRAWHEHGPQRAAVYWLGEPEVGAAAPNGARLINPASGLACPGRPGFWGSEESGFTLCFVFQPTTIDLSHGWKAVLSNEDYLDAGFRLRLQSGYLLLDAGQSGGTLRLVGHTRLVAGQTYVITVRYAPKGGQSSFYLNGEIEAQATNGVIHPSLHPLWLGSIGGVAPQPCLFGDVAVFSRLLSHRERKMVEAILTSKYATGLPNSEDRDLDGVPDAYELANGLDPATPDALGDEDRDGAVNQSEFAQATDPQVADSDRDGMPDGWEIDHGLNPLVRDGNGDPDVDGVTNLSEFEEGTDPQHTAPTPPALDFPRVRLWWRSEVGLSVTDRRVTGWADSSPRAHDGRPAEGRNGPSVSPDPWLGRPSLLGSSPGSLISDDVDLRTVLHQPGVTLMAAVGLPAALGAPGVFQPLLTAGGAELGAIDGRLAARSKVSGTVVTAPSARSSGPAIVTLTLPLPPGRARLYADGELLAEGEGLAPVLTAPVQLGGMTDPWPAEVGEIIVFAGVLPYRHRALWELVLEGKWQGAGPLAGDSDGDGVPDWWEWEAATDPAVRDGEADADFDGVSNLAAFQQRRCGLVWKDEDRDGLHDGWERAHALDSQRDDADLDLDGDGLSNVMEQAIGTRPNSIGDAPEAWAVVPVGAAAAPQVAVTFWSNHRSWRTRVVLEESERLTEGSWRLLTTPDPATPPAGGISRMAVALRPAAGARPTSHFRLRLFEE